MWCVGCSIEADMDKLSGEDTLCYPLLVLWLQKMQALLCIMGWILACLLCMLQCDPVLHGVLLIPFMHAGNCSAPVYACCCCYFRNLQRCRRLGGHAELVELQNQRVLVTDDTACNGCGRFIGSKVFYRYPSGVVVCSRCSGAIAAAGAGGCSTSSGGAAAGGLPHASMGDSTWEFV